MALRDPVLLFSCDPGNESAGVSIYFCHTNVTLLAHTTLNIWSYGASIEFIVTLRDICRNLPAQAIRPMFVYEKPVNGTHDSRGGVHRSAGHVLGYIMQVFHVIRSNMFAIPVPTWREHFYTEAYSTDGYKKAAFDEMAKRSITVSSHDEAEAILIGEFACAKLLSGDIAGLTKRPPRRPRLKKTLRKRIGRRKKK